MIDPLLRFGNAFGKRANGDPASCKRFLDLSILRLAVRVRVGRCRRIGNFAIERRRCIGSMGDVNESMFTITRAFVRLLPRSIPLA